MPLKKKLSLQSLKIDKTKSAAFQITESGTFTRGELAVNRNGILPSPAFDHKMVRRRSITVDKLEDIEVLEELGRGAGGKVMKAVHKPTDTPVALKTLNLKEDKKEEEIFKEVNLLFSANNPGVISFYGAFFANDVFHITLEYMDCGSLADIMKKQGPFPEDALGEIANHILDGLIYLHQERQIIHRDIKPSNILVNKQGISKIADFGVVSNSLHHNTARTFAGTVSYMAPERLRGEEYSYNSDIWSFGVTLAECALGKFPYPTPRDFWDMIFAVEKMDPPQIPEDKFSDEFRDFITQCLHKDPTKRPSAEDLKSHPFADRYRLPLGFLAEFLNPLPTIEEEGEKKKKKDPPVLKRWQSWFAGQTSSLEGTNVAPVSIMSSESEKMRVDMPREGGSAVLEPRGSILIPDSTPSPGSSSSAASEDLPRPESASGRSSSLMTSMRPGRGSLVQNSESSVVAPPAGKTPSISIFSSFKLGRG